MWVLKVKVISLPWPKVNYVWNFKLAFLRNHWPVKAKFHMKAYRFKEMKIYWYDAGHMTEMAAMPIYGKNPSKIFLSGTGGPISTKLGM